MVLPGVYRTAGSPRSWHQSVLSACLWAGDDACASHRTAAALWGLEDVAWDGVELSTARRVRRSGITVHFAAIPTRDRARVESIPLTGVARTLVDLGAMVGKEVVEAALADALRRRLTSLERLRARLDDLGGKGRRGAAVLRSLLQEWDPKAAPPESVLEARLIRLLRRARLPEPVRQFEIRERRTLLARVDLAYPDVQLAIEADGYRFHSGRVAWQRDLNRRNALTSRGWRVIHVTWTDVTSRPDDVVTEVRRALREPGQIRREPGQPPGFFAP
jgi:very-short-patch-repair endonuclease